MPAWLKITCPDVSVPLTILVTFFGMSTFLHVDAIWAEIPILVQTLPEKWELPAYITLGVAVICNIPPLIYFIVHTKWPNAGGGGPHGLKMVLVLFSVALVASVALIFFWNRVTLVNGDPHSVAFLTLVIAGGCVNFMSMMVFVGYMVKLPQAYIPAFHTGEGMAGFIFSILGLVQGSGMYTCVDKSIGYDHTLVPPANFSYAVPTRNTSIVDVKVDDMTTHAPTNVTLEALYVEPRYSVSVHFILALLMEMLCFISFLLIHFLPYFKKFHIKEAANHVKPKSKTKNNLANNVDGSLPCVDCGESTLPLQTVEECEEGPLTPNKDVGDGEPVEDKALMNQLDNKNSHDNTDSEDNDSKSEHEPIGSRAYVWLLVTTVFDSAVKFGILDAIITYSALPYGPLTMNLATRFSLFMLPLGSFAAYFMPTRSIAVINVHSFIGNAASIYIIVLSAMSPNLPLMTSVPELGSTLIILAWVLVVVTFGYKRSAISSLLRERGERALVWFSISCLTGSFLTNLPMFFFVSNLKLFKDVPPCG